MIIVKEYHRELCSFSAVELKDVHREIDSLHTSKIIKVNRDIFSEFIMHNFSKGISTARFPDILKRLN